MDKTIKRIFGRRRKWLRGTDAWALDHATVSCAEVSLEGLYSPSLVSSPHTAWLSPRSKTREFVWKALVLA
jgi:hypothetical protein